MAQTVFTLAPTSPVTIQSAVQSSSLTVSAANLDYINSVINLTFSAGGVTKYLTIPTASAQAILNNLMNNYSTLLANYILTNPPS